MRNHRFYSAFLGFLIVMLAAAQGFAGSPTSTGPATTTLSKEAENVAPRINRRIPPRIREKLESGYELAVQKLADEPGCRDLFARIGAHGVGMFSTTLYYQASLKMERAVCTEALAFTVVGGAPTWVCQRFAKLNTRRAARVLLHEALHRAGMNESPHDPDGLRPAAIDDLIEEACGL